MPLVFEQLIRFSASPLAFFHNSLLTHRRWHLVKQVASHSGQPQREAIDSATAGSHSGRPQIAATAGSHSKQQQWAATASRNSRQPQQAVTASSNSKQQQQAATASSNSKQQQQAASSNSGQQTGCEGKTRASSESPKRAFGVGLLFKRKQQRKATKDLGDRQDDSVNRWAQATGGREKPGGADSAT